MGFYRNRIVHPQADHMGVFSISPAVYSLHTRAKVILNIVLSKYADNCYTARL